MITTGKESSECINRIEKNYCLCCLRLLFKVNNRTNKNSSTFNKALAILFSLDINKLIFRLFFYSPIYE